jgi:hypothetical protein
VVNQVFENVHLIGRDVVEGNGRVRAAVHALKQKMIKIQYKSVLEIIAMAIALEVCIWILCDVKISANSHRGVLPMYYYILLLVRILWLLRIAFLTDIIFESLITTP